MAFRKTVKKILSKLQHGKRDDKSLGSPKDKQAHSRPSTASTETVRPPGANVYQHPKTPPTKPPFLREESEFPQKIDQDYHPSNVLASESAPVDVIGRDTRRRERYYEDDNDLYEPPRRSDRPQPLLDRDELSRSVDEASAKAFQPLMHHGEDAFPESVLEPGVLAARTMSNLTVDTQASSDYDQHSITTSLHAATVPSAGKQMMETFHKQRELNPLTHTISAPSHLASPVVETTDVETHVMPPIVNTTFKPVEHHHETRVLTTEHHHHHIHPQVQPVMEQHKLPTKYYLQSASAEDLREISAHEAASYGPPIYRGEHIVGRDKVGTEIFTPGPHETVRTRLATPHDREGRIVEGPIPSSLGLGDTEEQRKGKGAEHGDHDTDSYTSSLSEKSFDRSGMRDSKWLQDQQNDREVWDELHRVVTAPEVQAEKVTPKLRRMPVMRMGTFGSHGRRHQEEVEETQELHSSDF